MTAKRFKIADYPSDIEDTLTGKKYAMSSYGTHMEIICDLLNELDEKWIDEFSLRETLQQDLQRVEEENKQLKKQIEELKVDLKMAKIDGAIDRMAQRPMRW